MDDEFGIEPGGALQVLLVEGWGQRVAVIKLAIVLQQAVGDQLDVMAALHIGEALDCGLLRQAACDLAGDPRPVRALRLMRYPASQHDTPGLRLAGTCALEAEALEGNAHQDDVAEAGSARESVPDGVERKIRLRCALGVGRIGLDAERVALEEEASPVVVEGIEGDLDLVIVPERIAGQEMRADCTWCPVDTDKGQVEVATGVADVG